MSSINVNGPEGDPVIHVTAQPTRIAAGGIVLLTAETRLEGTFDVEWSVLGPVPLSAQDTRIALLGATTVTTGPLTLPDGGGRILATLDTSPLAAGSWQVVIRLIDRNGRANEEESPPIEVTPRPFAAGDDVAVTLKRTAVSPTPDQALWVAIRNSTNALGFEQYNRFIEFVVCGEPSFEAGQLTSKGTAHTLKKVKRRTALPFPNVERYRLLKAATEVFLMVRCGVDLGDFTGVDLEEESRRLNRTVDRGDLEAEMGQYLTLVAAGDGDFLEVLPYLGLIRLKLQDVPILDSQDRDDAAQICFGILAEKLTNPCFLELIWSYWLEEGLLVRAMNAISWRFQNRSSGPPGRDPLANLDIDPLRPLNNLLWAYLQDEQHRLSMLRRAYEYDHQYGLVLASRPGPPVRGADSRSRFVEAFHNLLTLTWEFHRQDDDTTVIADGFGVLNALKETHLLLTEGAHNQFGDLPSTARQEMLMQQWILSRPEVREFLPTRTMVAYNEPWMGPVDAMSKLQGWSDTPVQHFRDLATFGEQLLLGIRFGAWSAEFRPETAANWARYWRSELQGYIHAYRAVTGIDLVQRRPAIPGFQQRRRHGAYRG
jgi:hypothetical protein